MGLIISRAQPDDANALTQITIAAKRDEPLPQYRTHAFLTARTDKGDYVLDNDIRPVVSWDKAARLYDFMMMQSEMNPVLWTLAKDTNP